MPTAISTPKVYTVTGKADWTNELPKSPFDYDLRSRYAAVLGGSGDYLCTKKEELDDVTNFLRDGGIEDGKLSASQHCLA